MDDVHHMRHALTLAARALGRLAPNPAVGCVIVSPIGRIVGRGWTQPGGRPHAETVALAQASNAARGSTAYVILEPCAHLGQTPPCAEALIKAGISRVVAAVEDPDPRVQGKGFAMLRAAGIEVETGVLEREAAEMNAGFFSRIGKDRPLVTLKIAQDRAGHTVPPPGSPRWITNEESRRFAHLLRAKHDAILVGTSTVLADDPTLDCRLPGLEDRSPIRIVLDTHLRLPESAKLVQTARSIPTMVFTAAEGEDPLAKHGVEVLRVMHDAEGHPSLTAVLGVLAGRGITRLLVEGGATVIGSFLKAGLADRLEIFTAPTDLGEGAGGRIEGLADPAKFEKIAARRFGGDVLETWRARA
jgi:diaminohydroxyphosphoribosylaminopyrimidine deaminase/5-amino-6-(5-phosphoribosylamino)uracil reductase